MNFYEAFTLYLVVTAVIGHVLAYKIIKNKLTRKEVVQTVTPQQTQRFTEKQPKIDRRNKYTVNVDACERYLASRK